MDASLLYILSGKDSFWYGNIELVQMLSQMNMLESHPDAVMREDKDRDGHVYFTTFLTPPYLQSLWIWVRMS